MGRYDQIIKMCAEFELLAIASELQELQDWAEVLQDLAERNQTATFGGLHKKYWIAPLADMALAQGMSRSDFEHKLIEAHRKGLLRLSRADLTSAMPRDLIMRSEIKYPHANAEFHFVEFKPF